MRVAVLSDIHGNDYALKPVLEVIRREGLRRILVLGDVVGYYYNPHKVLEMLDSWDVEFIKGNHEVILDDLIRGRADHSTIKSKYGSGHEKAIERLSTDQLQRLLHAPSEKLLNFHGAKLLMCHGAPWDPELYLYPDTDESVLRRSNDSNVDFVTVGHSHYSFVYSTGTTFLVNAGSVGQSRCIGGMANWAILNLECRTVEIRYTPYDVRPLLGEIQLFDPALLYLSKILLRNNFQNV